MKNSKPRAIRVVKKKLDAPVLPIAKAISNHSISQAVDNWIEERNNSRNVERIFSTDNIVNWRKRPRTGELLEPVADLAATQINE